MSQPVVVVAYDPDWPRLFDELRGRVVTALGELAVVIEHVGSTSVPGLAAKPIIDMDVVIPSPADVPAAITRLAAIGYRHKGNLGILEREAFAPPPGSQSHHLYVCPLGSEEFRRHIAFRDYLRAHPEEAREYGACKQAAADRFRDDRAAYMLAKHELVAAMVQRALHSVQDG